jgi:hypothetical protein
MIRQVTTDEVQSLRDEIHELRTKYGDVIQTTLGDKEKMMEELKGVKT